MFTHISRDKRISPMFSHVMDKKTELRQKLQVFSPKQNKFQRKVDFSKKSHENLEMKQNNKIIKKSTILIGEYGLESVCSEIERGRGRNRDFLNLKNGNSKICQLRSNSQPFVERRKLFRNISKSPENFTSYQQFLRKSKSVAQGNNFYLNKKQEKSIKTRSSETTIDSLHQIKNKKFLEKKSQYFSNLCLHCEQKVSEIRKQVSQEKDKYERIRKIYQQKINQMEQNKKFCERNLGHIFSFQKFSKDIVPENVIIEFSLQTSMEEKTRTCRQTTDVGSSRISLLSINSKQDI